MLQWFLNAHFYVNLLWKSRVRRIIWKKIRGWISSLFLNSFLENWKYCLEEPEKWVFMIKKEAQHFPHSVLHFLWREELEIDGGRKEPGLRQSRFFAEDAYFSNAIRFRIHSYFKVLARCRFSFLVSHSHYKYALHRLNLFSRYAFEERRKEKVEKTLRNCFNLVPGIFQVTRVKLIATNYLTAIVSQV